MPVFRVHYADGVSFDIEAETPAQAREVAKVEHQGIIKKIKVVKEQADVR